ncbi:discoidin domain-containing protein [Blautia sp.]|uniref:discoidin domain-containing protein n=1 Tax=Blautia sp. TaxID=1955243 RepID=UPI002E7A93A0|nr:discoidin domain-containing protein [Blautia sp.]MEE0811885.1 discoidin domain-containing protein [Blautia sp.]
MKCERCGKELSDIDLYCQRCGKAVFPEYMDEDDVWAFYKSDEELIEILKEEGVEELPESLKKTNIPDVTEPALEETREEAPEEEILEQEEEPVSEEMTEEIQEEASEESENQEESAEPKEQEEITEEPENLEEEHPEELETSKEEIAEESLEESGKAAEEEEVSETEEKEAEDTENFSEEPERKIEDSIEGPETESFEEAELLQEVPLEEASQEETLQTEKAENREAEALEEDAWDFDEEEDEEEEDSAPVLTPQMKKARRWKWLGITVFLIACLGLGIYFGLNRMKEMENQEKQYYENLKKSSQEPVQTPEEQPKEPAEDASAETQTPAEEPKEEPKEETPKEEPPKEEAKKEYFKLVNPDEIDFSQYNKIQPASTEENSVKESESYDYSSKSVVDGDVTTSWQENEEGAGEGKGFQLNLDGVHKIRYMVLHLGNWRSDQLWDYNARPKTLTIQVGDQQKKDVEFPNEKKKFCLSFEEPVEAAYVSAYIKEAYEGSRWNDNCISEIELYE